MNSMKEPRPFQRAGLSTHEKEELHVSENDQAAEDIEALLNRTFALEILIAIIMRDLLSPAACGRILDSLRQHAVYPSVAPPSVVPLHKHTPALSLALEELHDALVKVFVR